ncbi:Integrin beta-PS, partial [Armadillidium nasatum]
MEFSVRYIFIPKGKPETLNIRFKFVRGYFLELYYLMDMSKSMEQDKETIVRLADDLATELKKLTPNLKLGFGSFLDKDSVNSAKLSTNWDDPEGGMDALIQAMICEDIGWQTTTTRHLIVYVSGSAFKYAGDGKLAGLTTPNDMECHLDDEGNYLFSSLQDYPSISQVENASKDKRMHVIFAVKENVLPLYREVSTLIAQSEASELKEDSSNIIEIITSIYEDISSTLIMTDDSYKFPFLELSYAAKCGQGQDFVEGLSRCEDVDINEEIQFNVTFKISSCAPVGEHYSSIQENSEICSYNGKYACGVCVCNEGFTGKHCECEDTLDSTSGTENCKAPGDLTGKDCSGHGACKCGLCECQRGIEGNLQWKYQGEFCECSNFDCPKLSGFLCSNHGRCDCSKCSCDVGWKGEDCSCDAGQDRCSCEGRCGEYNDCIMCKIYKTGPYLASCDEKCSKITIEEVDEIEGTENEKRCSYKDDKGCLVISSYEPTQENVVKLQKEPNCSGKLKTYVVIGSMILLILLIGLLALIIWKCWVTIKDKREYKKFLQESQAARFTQVFIDKFIQFSYI